MDEALKQIMEAARRMHGFVTTDVDASPTPDVVAHARVSCLQLAFQLWVQNNANKTAEEAVRKLLQEQLGSKFAKL